MSVLLSPHFALAELTHSATAVGLGLPNTPTPTVIENLTRLAAVLEQVRALAGDRPLRINSGYRCPELNAAVGGARDSYHVDGCAADFDPPVTMTHDQLQQKIAADPAIKFDLLMEEGTTKPEASGGSRWLHLQIARSAAPRRLVRDAIVSRLGGKIERTIAG